jgi:hypothetical protein
LETIKVRIPGQQGHIGSAAKTTINTRLYLPLSLTPGRE